MTPSRDPDRLIHEFLLEGEEQLHDQVYDAIRAEIEQKRQRVVIGGPWRLPEMNKILTFGLGAAALVVAVFVGGQLLGSPTASPGKDTATQGVHVLFNGTDGQVPITVTTPAHGWSGEPAGAALCWGDVAACAGAPSGAGIFAFEGRDYLVYGDACHQPSPRADTRARTVGDLVDALGRQVHRHGSLVPTDIVLDGRAGKKINLYSDASPGDCDFTEDRIGFGLFRIPGDDMALYSPDPSRKEEVWAVDVNGLIIVLVAAYYPDTPASVVAELRAIAESATFEGP